VTMTARLTVTCAGRDREGRPTHAREVVADLGIDDAVGVVLMPSAQQRGNPEAGPPRAFGDDLSCRVCGDAVRVGRAQRRGLRRVMMKANAAGIHELPLHLLRK
jgi:hypothetical protein